ncbi:MAG: diguanylate cyclase [Massilia sp.]|nr:diguanylate cyclase [Massilia sp.]
MLNSALHNRVLLAGHEGAASADLHAVMAGLGLAVVHADSALQALDHARGADFVLMLAAISGDGDGSGHDSGQLELVRRLHANPRSSHTPLIVLAPRADASFPLEAWYRAGAIDVLVGPTATPILAAKLGFLVDAARSAAGRRGAEEALRETRGRLATTVADAGHSEERYRTLFEAIDEGVCIIEMLYDDAGQPCDYRFLEMNSAFVKHTGLVDAVGKTVLEMVPGHDRHWFDTYGRVAATGEAIRFVDEAAAMGRWFDVYATRIGAAGSRKLAVLFNDITERKRTETELHRLAADLTAADRRKTEFLATLAHELRNPLAPLRSALEVLRLGGGDPSASGRLLGVMQRQLGHMVELVDDLLDVARIQRGQVELKRSAIDLKDVLDAAVEAAMPAIEQHGHRLRTEIAAAPLPLLADATRLTQVVSNLLNNAAKYTPRGGVVTLGARRDQGHVVIAVADNGIGIAPESTEEVFGMFNQVGRQHDRSQGGLGIGLSLVRSLVELHGGSVTARSAGVGLGSEFTVRLPLAAAVAGPVPGPVAEPDPGPASPPLARLHAVRVLVVDDNRDAADMLSALLELLGHVAQVANDGAAALEAMQDFRPQAVFLDLGMPVMNGYQVAQAIRNDRRFDQPLLVALTGWGGEDDRARTRAAGFDLHLTKPVDLDTVQKMLAGL